ncbi:MAG: MBL fold metallo-hydrolase [Deltaproteobacteria bacterium]|nr:MBL fold metallo-hydrolase [Deltaproteobacteria bacterium]
MDLICLCVKTDKHTVLFDTGFGGVIPTTGQLIQNLQDSKISRSEIDTVILSHGHPDHICGISGSNNQPNFPNAQYYMFKREWEYWMSKPDFSEVDEFIRQLTFTSIQKNLVPLKGRIQLLEKESEIVPGIKFLTTPGHTPGHISFVISSDKESLIILCDLFHRTIEIEDPSLFLLPPMTSEANISRAKLLSQVRIEDLLFSGHFSFPGVGKLYKSGDVQKWQPIAI